MASLGGLPESLRLPEGILIVPGAPSDPDRYLFLLEDAEEEIDMLSGVSSPRVVFFGHTHVPAAFVRRKDGSTVSAPLEGLQIGGGETAMLNPGSVGQPRDRNHHASFLVFDTSTGRVSWIRVPYDVRSCQRKGRGGGAHRGSDRRHRRGEAFFSAARGSPDVFRPQVSRPDRACYDKGETGDVDGGGRELRLLPRFRWPGGQRGGG